MTIDTIPPAQAGHINPPSRTAPVFNNPSMTPGLYLMYGKKTSGKTLLSLAFAHQMKAQGVLTAFTPMMEPRAPNTFDLLRADRWFNWFNQSVSNLRGGLLVIDSMNYVVGAVPQVTEILKTMQQVTYPGGLSPRDVIGVNVHNQIAEANDCVVIGTINSELFPVVDVLEGACEGRILIQSSSGIVNIRNRYTRSAEMFRIDEVAHTKALDELGYGRKTSSTHARELVTF